MSMQHEQQARATQALMRTGIDPRVRDLYPRVDMNRTLGRLGAHQQPDGAAAELHQMTVEHTGHHPATGSAICMPMDFFAWKQRGSYEKRDLAVSSASAGGYLVGTENKGFAEYLRARTVAGRMGATVLDDLQGNVTIPRQTGAGSAYWLATEATGIAEGQQTFAQLALTPKSVGAYTELSRQLTTQSSPSAEAVVMDDLAKVVDAAMDLAALAGTGAAGQPLGIIGSAGVGSVTGTSIDYAKVLEFQADVAAANALTGKLGYATTPAVAALLMGRVRFSGTASPLWEGSVNDGQVLGHRAMSSMQLPAGTMIFGDWSQLVLAFWGPLEIAVNPFANFSAGIIGVRVMLSMDVGVRQPAAFSVASSIT